MMVPSHKRKRSNDKGQPESNRISTYSLFFVSIILISLAEGAYSEDQETYHRGAAQSRFFKSSSENNNNIRKKPLETPTYNALLQNNNESLQKSGAAAEDGFLDWCRTSLGIETILEIQYFEYYDYFEEILTDLDEWEDPDVAARTPPLTLVRGLAASRHISVGETVIRIPLHGLLSVKTTIDEDPFLSPLLGPEVRRQHGWTVSSLSSSDGDDDVVFLHELSLLAVALLYHRNLGSESPLAPYVRILEESRIESMPFLWSQSQSMRLPTGIRDVALGIRRDIRDMYDTVLKVLIEKFPDVFGDKEGGDDWIFSFQNFQWAFAIVNSRHWQLPIDDLKEEDDEKEPSHGTGVSSPPRQQPVVEDQVPPADMPTDTWVQEQEEIDEEVKKTTGDTQLADHSFLSPVADLLNFGPSCTQGRYDASSHTFEIVATCSFRKGQEVTFWYSDECDDIMVGMYGFSHPMMPQCKSSDEYRLQVEELQEQVEEMEQQLRDSYQQLDDVHDELEFAESILERCECCVYEPPSSRSQRSPRRHRHKAKKLLEPHVRGSPSGHASVEERHGVRRMRMISRRSEF